MGISNIFFSLDLILRVCKLLVFFTFVLNFICEDMVYLSLKILDDMPVEILQTF